VGGSGGGTLQVINTNIHVPASVVLAIFRTISHAGRLIIPAFVVLVLAYSTVTSMPSIRRKGI
jgi:hypothetical protein